MGLDVVSMAIARNYTDKSIEGLGAVKGAPCTIKSQTETDDYYIITFEWTVNKQFFFIAKNLYTNYLTF